MFGVNNAANFKVSLTNQEMLRKMDLGQKILRGIPVEGYVAEEAVGSHFFRAAPKTVVKRRMKPHDTKKGRAKKEEESDGSGDEAGQHMQASPEAPKKKKHRVIKRA